MSERIDVTDRVVTILGLPMSIDTLCAILTAHERAAQNNGNACFMRKRDDGMFEIVERKTEAKNEQ